MQKYRADTSTPQADGAVLWFAQWMGGLSLAKIDNCDLSMAGDMRRTVYITGEPDTFFSQPATEKRRDAAFQRPLGNAVLVFLGEIQRDT